MIVSTRALLAALVFAALLSACNGSSQMKSLDDARDAVAKGKSADAAIILKSILQRQPDSVEARLMFGKLLLQGGNAGAAEVELRKAQELTAKPDAYAPLLAKAMVANGKPKQVVSEFAGQKLDDPGAQAELMAALAQAHVHLGERDKASRLIDDALALAPGNVAASLIRARLLAGRGAVDEALRLLESLGQAPDPEFARLQADLMLLSGNRAQAVALYRKLLDRSPRDLYVHSQIIAIDLLERNVDAAKKQLAVLRKLYPDHPQVTYLEAGIALRSGAYAQARELSARLLSQTRDNPQVLLLAGEAELKTNALVQAEAHLNKLLALEPQALHARRLLAIIHIRTGEPALALNTLRPAMDAKTKDTETLMLAAEAHLLLGDSRMAEPIYQQVARQEPANVKARTALALTQLARGDVLGAITELESIAAKDEGSLADLVLVDVRLRQRDLQGALRAIDALEKKQPERALPALLRGTVYAQMRRHAAARESYEAASKRDPLFFPALKALADMDLSELRPDLARQRYEALLKVEPKQAQAYVELAAMTLRQGGPAAEVAQLLSKAIESRPTEPSYRVMLVNHWLSRGDPRQALSVAQAATAAIPDASSVLDALGRAQVANRETTQALATFGQLAAKDPKSAFPQLRLADVHAKTGNMRAAEAALRKALEIAPDLVAANRGLIVMAMRARDSARALQLARAFQARRPRDVEGYLMEADILAAAKQWDAAAKALRTAMSKDDGAVAAVRLHILLGEHPGAGDAAELAREWLRGHPKDTALRTRLGQVAMDSGDHAAAEQVYRQILQLDPNNAVAANNLAWLMAREKKSGAVAMAEEALRLAPQQPRVMDTLAFALAQEGDIQRAIAVSRSAVRADPDMAPLRLTLAKLYLQAQDKKAARAELEALSKLGERFKSQPEVQALLGAL